jgi:hypothetical protein
MLNALRIARNRADFLFGDDVTTYLEATIEALVRYKHLAADIDCLLEDSTDLKIKGLGIWPQSLKKYATFTEATLFPAFSDLDAFATRLEPKPARQECGLTVFHYGRGGCNFGAFHDHQNGCTLAASPWAGQRMPWSC